LLFPTVAGGYAKNKNKKNILAHFPNLNNQKEIGKGKNIGRKENKTRGIFSKAQVLIANV